MYEDIFALLSVLIRHLVGHILSIFSQGIDRFWHIIICTYIVDVMYIIGRCIFRNGKYYKDCADMRSKR